MIFPERTHKEVALNVRTFRSCSENQSRFLDACFGIGDYADGNILRHVLGGGAGFGGKSYTIRTGVIECALRLVKAGVENPVQLVTCQTLGDLEERHLMELGKDRHAVTGEDNSLANFGTVAGTKTGKYHFKFAGKYAKLGTVVFSHAQQLDRRRGVQYNAIWVDELTQFERSDFDAFKYMLRSGVKVPFLLFAAATNPDGIGNEWVKNMWVDRKFENEPIPVEEQKKFYYIPFTVEDNPVANKEAYLMLESIADVQLRNSRRYGIWDILTHTRFRYDRNVHTFTWREFEEFYDATGSVSAKDLLRSGIFFIWGSLDYGTAKDSASCYHLHAKDSDGYKWTFGELWMENTLLPSQAKQILTFERGLEVKTRYCDPALKITGNDTTGQSRIDLFMDNGVVLWASVNDREAGWACFDVELDHELPTSTSPGRPPRWRIHESCQELHKFLRNAPRNPARPEDIDPKFKRDHAETVQGTV